MPNTPQLTDRNALICNRARALAAGEPAMFLQHQAADDIQERLILVNRTFTNPAIITPFADIWRAVVPEAYILSDDDTLDLKEQAHDLVIHALSLHWANDPVGQIIQARRALKPDGLFLAVLFGGQTLNELRAALAAAESDISGGLSPRVLPMAEIRDLGGLLQRGGFALPVADAVTTTVRYSSLLHLMRDLRAMGEANAMTARSRTPLRRSILTRAESIYRDNFASDDHLPATFEMVFLTGWAPSADQPQPLRPGSASQRLADALGTAEVALKAEKGNAE